MIKPLSIDSTCSILAEEDFQFTKSFLTELEERKVAVKISVLEERPSELTIYTSEEQNLSRNMPILENLGFCIDSEVSYTAKFESLVLFARRYYLDCDDAERFKTARENVEKVIEGALLGKVKNTPLNALAYLANLGPEEIGLVRAFATYEDQLIPILSETMIGHTLVKNHELASCYVAYFKIRFDPAQKGRENALKKKGEEIEALLREVENISEDRVLAIFYRILQATLRTNYYLGQSDPTRLLRDCAFSFKVDVTQLALYLKGIQPRIEAFVYHRNLQGLHLRRTLVSRGGLRWSDRPDDYRNEIKALMQAQRGKNSIIIPSGAKGGFIITGEKPREKFAEYYSLFIDALLDLVDNREDDAVVRPAEMVCYDGDDPYFVVAADKGTASMSDTANAICQHRGFWLGDAFASGGSKGYNHKEIGITAKGAIKTAERFFIEQGVNFYEESITVIGIGSPSGDVFGNGMLLSEKFKLVGAIGSREVFIDPEPEIAAAFAERKRLFEEGQGWSHYDKKLISPGGGVFMKSEKAIKLTPEIKKLFNIKKETVSGEELSRYVLTAKCDMLYNGGVGTYVKASTESDSEIGDKPNEGVRVNASDLRAAVVCEGGNLGFTQLARLEYAKRGGRINMDSIDNSAGVQTSDYEVNLKIILNALERKGAISEEDRMEVLRSLIPTVERTVLWSNYFQGLALSLDELRSKEEPERFQKTVAVLEEHVENFERVTFGIPGRDDFASGTGKNGALLRPILSVLLSYAKIFVKAVLVRHPEFLESDFASKYVYRYFPKTFGTLYKKEVETHPLRREIIATFISSKAIDAMGSSFIHDFGELGPDRFLLKIKAFLSVSQLIGASDVRHALFREDYKIPAKRQYELLRELEHCTHFSVEWILEHGEYKVALADHLLEYSAALAHFLETVDGKYLKVKVGENEKLTRYFSMIDYVKLALTIISVKESTHQEFGPVADLFFTATQDLDIFFITDKIKVIPAESLWEERLKEELEKDVFETVFRTIEKIMNFKRSNETIEEGYKAFVTINKERYDCYLEDLASLKAAPSTGYVNLSVVVNSLKRIAGGED